MMKYYLLLWMYDETPNQINWRLDFRSKPSFQIGLNLITKLELGIEMVEIEVKSMHTKHKNKNEMSKQRTRCTSS